METGRIREQAAATPFSMRLRLNITRSPTVLLGHGNLQFQPLSAPAPTPLPAVAQFARGRMTMLSSLLLLLWTADLPLQRTRALEPRCRRLLQYTHRPVWCHQRRRPFDSCICSAFALFFLLLSRELFSSYVPGLQRLAVALFRTRLCTSSSSNQSTHFSISTQPPSCEFAPIPLFVLFFC